MSTRRSYTLIDRQSVTGGWEIHRSDCQDIKRKRGNRHHITVKSVTPLSGAQAFRNYWLDEDVRELGWGDDDVRIMDCATKESN